MGLEVGAPPASGLGISERHLDHYRGQSRAKLDPNANNVYVPIDQPMSFEEALQLTNFGKFNYYLILITGMVMANMYAEMLGIGYVMPVAECDLELTTDRRGILGAVSFIGIISGSHLWGFLADTKGRRRIIVPTLFLTFACTLLSSLTSNFWLFAVFRLLNGFFLCGSSGTVFAYLGEFHTMIYRSRAFVVAAVLNSLICLLVPIIGWLTINQTWELDMPFLAVTFKPWRLFVICCGMPGLMSAVALLMFPESPKFILAQGNPAETIEILQRIHRSNNGCSKAPLRISSIIEEKDTTNEFDRKHVLRSMWRQTVPLFLPPYLKRTIILCSIHFGISISSSGMYLWFPEILNRIHGFIALNSEQYVNICDVLHMTKSNLTELWNDDSVVALRTECVSELDILTYAYSFALDVLYVIGYVMISLFLKRVGGVPILFCIVVSCGLSGVVATCLTNPPIAINLVVVMFLGAVVCPLLNAATVELYPTSIRAMAVSIGMMSGRLGAIFGTNFFALLVDSYCQLTFLFGSGALIMSGCLALFIRNMS